MVYCHAVNRVAQTTSGNECYESAVNGAELLEKNCVREAQWQHPAGLRDWKQSISNFAGPSKETAHGFCQKQDKP